MRLLPATDYLVKKQQQNPRGCAAGIDVNEADVLLAMFMLKMQYGALVWPFVIKSRNHKTLEQLSKSLETLGFKCDAVETEIDFDSLDFKLSVPEPV